MGLDIYVGSITRYLCRDWETVIQQYAREAGIELTMVREHDPPDAITDPSEVLGHVLSWREGLQQIAREAGVLELDWDERAEAPYFTDKPTWEAYGDLILWAAHEQIGTRAPTSSVENWEDDSAYREALSRLTDYPTLIHGAEVWLPVEFRATFEAPWVTGHPMVFGSVQQLARVLSLINGRTWSGSEDEMRGWRREGKVSGDSLETGARFACALLHELAGEALAHRLVMIMDW